MLHSFFLCDREGRILVSKYFDAAAVHRDERALWEQEVFQVTHCGWRSCVDTAQVAPCRDLLIVFKGFGGLMLFLAGGAEYDEVMLLTIIDHLEKTIAKLCEKDLEKDAAKDWSKDVEGMHGKVCVAIEEMVNMGHVEHLDTETILRLSKLKKPVQS